MVSGQKVRFNADGLRWVNSFKKQPVDWKTRTGTLLVSMKDPTMGRIKWDGNKSLSDFIPLRFFELIEGRDIAA